MGNSLSAEEIENILDTFAEDGSLSGTASKTNHTKETVEKYVEKARDKGDERALAFDGDEENTFQDQYKNFELGESPFDAEEIDEEARRYIETSPGEFIKDFFSNLEVGIKNKWIIIQARRADRREKLPTKESLVADLLNMSSGIAQSAHLEANYIADEYWAEAQKYLRKTGHEAADMSIMNQARNPAMAGKVAGGQSESYGQEFVGPGAATGQASMQGGQDQMMQMMMQELRQLRQELNRVRSQGGGGDTSQKTLDRLKDLKAEKEILEELSGGDERLGQIEEQMMRLQQQIQQGAAAGDGSSPPTSGTFEDRLLHLASREESVSMREVLDYLDDRSEAEEHPDVLEKKYEKQMKEAELEHQSERTDRFADTIENFADRIGEGIGRQLVGDDTDQSQQQPAQSEPAAANGGMNAAMGQAPDPPDAQAPQAAADMAAAGAAEEQADECPHCGTQMQLTVGGEYCPECQYGIGQCDLCNFPIEIPPIGEANYARCGTCENIVEVPEEPDGLIECSQCGWEGHGEDLRGELTECGKCGEYRPVKRAVDETEMMEELDNLMGD